MWRDATVDISSLWSTISISLKHSPSLSSLQLFLKRSRDHKLDIFIDWAHGFMGSKRKPEELSTYITAAMHALVPHMHRWQSVDIAWEIARCGRLNDMFGPLFTRRADVLTYLSVYCFDYLDYLPLNGRGQLHYFQQIFTAPRLTTLILRSMPSGFELECPADFFPAIEDRTWSEGGRKFKVDAAAPPVSLLRKLVTNRRKAREKDPDMGLETISSLKIYIEKATTVEEERFFTDNVQDFVWTLGSPSWCSDISHQHSRSYHANRLAVQWTNG
ncbi:uncharacterized protein FIBRA_06700 [Fibroporia radiculosa]|uniref:Uncharacterized protein n=1 Tax=Fibroporia radiculosa TaxID=599839 RepID=J4H478_9APHY|nr:uncharacterized protein FIBRA_06700 [Fibroporia radiculosa]CCM04519.1 predicted protein [Fibroporia radiculosa]